MGRKLLWGFIGLFIFMIILAVIAYGCLPSAGVSSMVIIWGFQVDFYKNALIILVLACLMGICAVRIELRKEKSAGFKVVIGVQMVIILIALLGVGVHLFTNFSEYRKVPLVVSPDGKHAIYQAGGDSDIFGASSGYMHYAVQTDRYEYTRAFYCYDEEDFPIIRWYEDGFLVSYSCRKPGDDVSVESDSYRKPGDTAFAENDSEEVDYDIAPESVNGEHVEYEKRAEGYFFFYQY